MTALDNIGKRFLTLQKGSKEEKEDDDETEVRSRPSPFPNRLHQSVITLRCLRSQAELESGVDEFMSSTLDSVSSPGNMEFSRMKGGIWGFRSDKTEKVRPPCLFAATWELRSGARR